MQHFDCPELYPDIGDLTPQELAERNTYGFIPSRGETAPTAPTSEPPRYATPPAANYSPQLDEIITALAALSRQTQRLTAEVSCIKRALRGDGDGDARRAPAGAAENDPDASRPYAAPRPTTPPAKAQVGVEYMTALSAAVRLGCSTAHVKRIPGIQFVKQGAKILFTRESVEAEAARRKTLRKGGKGQSVNAAGGRKQAK